MLEGKRISELDTVTNLQNGCCFPVLSQGATKRITFGSLLSEIENNLPETGIEEVKKDVAELKVKSEQIDTLSADVENVKEEVADVDEMVQGQNATIRNYSEKVDTLEQIVEDTHFEDVLELEGQVRANTTNITHKLDNTTSPDNAGKVVGVDEDGSLTFVEGGGGGSALVPDITQAEYDELTPEEQNNGQIRHITDAEETPVPFAVVNDSQMLATNVLTAQKTLHLPTVVISANADATKTIDTYYQTDGASVKVLLLNGHSGATFTINGKTVYANKDGVAVAVPSHTINSVAWYVQAYTTLELIYLSSLDDGNGGWLVVGNPVVLSGKVVNGNNTTSYEVRANGFIKQSGYHEKVGGNNYVVFPIVFLSYYYPLGTYCKYGGSYHSYPLFFDNMTLEQMQPRYNGATEQANYKFHWQAEGY